MIYLKGPVRSDTVANLKSFRGFYFLKFYDANLKDCQQQANELHSCNPRKRKEAEVYFTSVKYSIQLQICNLNSFGKIKEKICMTKVTRVASVWQMQEK